MAPFLLVQPKFGGGLLRLDKIRGDFQRRWRIERLGSH